MAQCFALLGWSLPVIESMEKLGKPYVVVSFPEFEDYAKEHGIPFVGWNFKEWGDQSNSLLLAEKLRPFNADVAVPLYEETVEWAGALNSLYRDDPRVQNRAFLFRHKAMMKRKALLGGLRVGLFEEVYNKQQVKDFFKRLNEAELKLEHEEDYWVHLKPFSAAGTVGHKFLRSLKDVDEKVVDRDFPCMVESHLAGREFSCEAFIHKGKVRFLNITDYVHLGYSNFVPEGPELHEKRPMILREIEKLVKVFGIEYGMIHPEFFIGEDDTIYFGEVASRIPGGHILDLVTKAWGFDALQAFIMCHDPNASEEELDSLFPKERPEAYAGCLMIYPKPGSRVKSLNFPEELQEDPYFEEHTLYQPSEHKVPDEREGFGNHYGTIFLRGEDPHRMRELLLHYEGVDFYQ